MMVNEAQMDCAELSVGNEEFHISIWIFLTSSSQFLPSTLTPDITELCTRWKDLTAWVVCRQKTAMTHHAVHSPGYVYWQRFFVGDLEWNFRSMSFSLPSWTGLIVNNPLLTHMYSIYYNTVNSNHLSWDCSRIGRSKNKNYGPVE